MRTILTGTMAWVCVAAASIGQPLQAEPRGADHYLGQSLMVVMTAVRVLSASTPLGCDEGGICLVGASLDLSETYTLHRDFQAGRTYVLFAGGDEDARDVDLAILDRDGRPLTADVREDRLALVYFEPPKTGTYTIRMRLSQCRAPHSFCAVVVLRANGVDVPALNLGLAGDRFIDQCRLANAVRGLLGGDLRFLDRPEHGAVWGVVLRGGASQTIGNVLFGAKPVTIVATGDTQARDLDLFLHDGDGKLLAQDTGPDAKPILRRAAGAEQLHSITLKNAGDGNPTTFALFGVLEDR